MPVLLLLLSLLLACSNAARPARLSDGENTASWKCPDTGLRWLAPADSGAPDRPWRPPGKPDGKAGKRAPLPSLRLHYSEAGEEGTRRIGSEVLIQPLLASSEDLNGDHRADLILLESSGEHQRILVLLGCGNDRYLPAFDQMADGIAVEEDPRRGARRKSLRLEWIPIGSEYQENRVLRWNGAAFAAACEYRVPVDSLGIRPPGGCP